MSDLKLDPNTNDIVMTQGRPETVTGRGAKAQRIRSRLMTVLGEWFLDTSFGLDYLNVVFAKATSRAVLAAHVKREILRSADPGDIITQFEMNYNGITRTLSTATVLESPDGTIITVET